MNVLAIDYGEKRVGIAIGDTETGIAFPRDIIGPKDAFSYISSLCDAEKVELVLVGNPVLPGGRETQQTENAKRFLDGLEQFFFHHQQNIPLRLWDERFSSKTAQETGKKMGLSQKQLRGKLDHSSAAIFLQVYFDSLL